MTAYVEHAANALTKSLRKAPVLAAAVSISGCPLHISLVPSLRWRPRPMRCGMCVRAASDARMNYFDVRDA